MGANRLRGLLVVLAAIVAQGCHPCDQALDKLKNECGFIDDVQATQCDEFQACWAGCINAAPCEELADQAPGSAYSKCLDTCLAEHPPPPM